MSFKDRFKGKTSIINKEGIESSLTSNFNPISKGGNFRTENDEFKNIDYSSMSEIYGKEMNGLATVDMNYSRNTPNTVSVMTRNENHTVKPIKPKIYKKSSINELDQESSNDGNSNITPNQRNSRMNSIGNKDNKIKPLNEFLNDIKLQNETERNLAKANNLYEVSKLKNNQIRSNPNEKPPIPGSQYRNLRNSENSVNTTPGKRAIKSEGFAVNNAKSIDSTLRFNGNLVLEKEEAFSPIQNNNQNDTTMQKQGYKPYTLKEYQGMKDLPGYRPRSLGPNTETEEWEIQKQKREKMKDYSSLVRADHVYKLRKKRYSNERIKEEDEEDESRNQDTQLHKSNQRYSDLDIDFLNLLNSVGRKI